MRGLGLWPRLASRNEIERPVIRSALLLLIFSAVHWVRGRLDRFVTGSHAEFMRVLAPPIRPCDLLALDKVVFDQNSDAARIVVPIWRVERLQQGQLCVAIGQ